MIYIWIVFYVMLYNVLTVRLFVVCLGSRMGVLFAWLWGGVMGGLVDVRYGSWYTNCWGYCVLDVTLICCRAGGGLVPYTSLLVGGVGVGWLPVGVLRVAEDLDVVDYGWYQVSCILCHYAFVWCRVVGWFMVVLGRLYVCIFVVECKWAFIQGFGWGSVV